MYFPWQVRHLVGVQAMRCTTCAELQKLTAKQHLEAEEKDRQYTLEQVGHVRARGVP